MKDTNYIVGEIYEIDPLIQINFGSGPQPCKFYAKLIGFNSEGDPVFERGGDYESWGAATAIITAVRKDAP